jgi:hypothetical protein
MRSVLAGILASLLFFALAGAASANDDATTGTLADPDLTALKQAVDEFRAELATLADVCALTKETADAAAREDCAARYAALRAEFKKVKQAALVLVRNQREWAKRSKQEAEQLKKETEKVDAAKHDEDSMKSKTVAEKIKWVDDRLLQDKADMEAALQRAKDAREAAAGLTGERLEDAKAVAAKWDEKAAQYAEDIKRLTAMRQQLVAAQNSPKACASNTSACAKKAPKACVSTGTTSCGTAREKLAQQLKSLDETIAYKRGKLADLNELLAYKLAQADATTGEERQHWLDLAQGVREEIAQWTGYLNDLLKQREELVKKLNGTPVSDTKACAMTTTSCADLARQLKSIDDLVAYKLQKVAEAKAAGDQEAVRYWTNLINDLLAQRAEIAAKLNAVK